MVHPYSTSAPFAALAALTALAAGELVFDDPVATYWTDNAASGREANDAAS